jgi:hypothetical protein
MASSHNYDQRTRLALSLICAISFTTLSPALKRTQDFSADPQYHRRSGHITCTLYLKHQEHPNFSTLELNVKNGIFLCFVGIFLCFVYFFWQLSLQQ